MTRLAALVLALWAGAALADGPARHLGTYVWEEDFAAFGGFSGLHVSDDGMSFIAISDRATLAEGRFERTRGRITGVRLTALSALPDENGNPITGRRADSEGLAVARNGDRFISFEGVARVRIEDRGDGLPQRLVRHPDFAAMQGNSSLEALAISRGGALYTIPERSGRADRPFPVYRLGPGGWTVPFTIPRRGAYLISGADIGPDGRLYVLERDFVGVGFRNRVRRFNLDGTGEVVLMTSSLGEHDNLEGISVWRGQEGRLRMTMISDDNFRLFQETQFVEYVLPD